MIQSEQQKNRENAEKAGNLFSHYLDEQKIPYYFIDQSKGKYSNEFRENAMQRPDFIIHTKYAIYYIDVKCRKRSSLGKNFENRFYLNRNEISRLLKFQNEFNTTVWIAFIDINNSTDFYFSSISDIFEYFKNIENNFKIDYPDIYEYFSTLDIFFDIPNDFLFEHLSLENGFSKEPNLSFIKNETGHYVDKTIAKLKS